MRKGIIPKLSIGVALAACVGFASVPAAHAQELGGTTVHLQPATTLIMPFDVSEGHASFQLVSRLPDGSPDAVATHWSYWSDSCDHLADVFICLTPNDTIVVDPTALQGQLQTGGTNTNTGPVINLAGSKGFVTVTAYPADPDSQSCSVADPDTLVDVPDLIGSWVVANTGSNAAFGNDAIGILDGQTLPDGTSFFLEPPGTAGLWLQTYNPQTLTDSEVFFIGVAFPAGNGQFALSEIGPIPPGLPDGNAVNCDGQYCNNVEACVSTPDIRIKCASVLKIADNDALTGISLDSIIPKTIAADTSGFVELLNCVLGDGVGGTFPIGSGTIGSTDIDNAFVFAFHGMAVGAFGTSVTGKYTTE